MALRAHTHRTTTASHGCDSRCTNTSSELSIYRIASRRRERRSKLCNVYTISSNTYSKLVITYSQAFRTHHYTIEMRRFGTPENCVRTHTELKLAKLMCVSPNSTAMNAARWDFGVEPVLSFCMPVQCCADSGTQNTRANLCLRATIVCRLKIKSPKNFEEEKKNKSKEIKEFCSPVIVVKWCLIIVIWVTREYDESDGQNEHILILV